MPLAIRVHQFGGPEVLRWEEVTVRPPRPHEVRLRHTAIGLNFVEVSQRRGNFPFRLPFVPGNEGAGIVEEIGAEVSGIKVGDRVAYAPVPGSYSEIRVIPAERLILIPDSIDDRTAAAMMLQGMTAQYLLRRTYKVKAGETILVHAAAGGVGLILCQWAKHLGATVIGVVSTAAKAELAMAHGAAHVIVGHANLAAEVKKLTGGAMVPVVYDSVGRDTFMPSIDSLASLGLMVSYGNASGPVPPVDISMLSAKGSLYLTRPTLNTYTAKRSDLVATANDLFDVVAKGIVSIRVNQTFALKDAAAAHIALESRATTGSTVLVP